MHQTNLCSWICKSALALAVLVSSVSNADAGWGSQGSWGGSSGGGSSGGWGSSGGYGGSSGGSSGGWGSTGGGRRGLFHHHHRARRGGSSGGWSGGSSGGYGGSSGGWGSSGGFDGFSGGSSGGWGSSGGEMMGGGAYYSPSVVMPEGDLPMDTTNPPATGDAAPPPMPPPPATDGASQRADGTLIVEVPSNAKIFVNNRLTSTPGEIREYVSRNLVRGYNYSYEVRAEMEVEGNTVTETKKVDLRAGVPTKIAFNLAPATQEVETSITVKVPANAKVNLGGNDTNASGETRVYRTSALNAGAEWKDYKIVVTAEIDGRQITKEQTFNLKAGDNKELSFDFDTASVADAR